MTRGFYPLLFLGALAFFSFASEIPEASIKLCRTAAADGMVLLENNNEALPLKKGEKVALFGQAQIHFTKVGSGSGDVNSPYAVNFLDGARKRSELGDLELAETFAQKYEADKNYFPTAEEIKEAAAEYKTAVLFLTRQAGEGGDRTASKGSYYLSDEEEKIISLISQADFQKFIVAINVGAIIDLSFIDTFKVDALLYVWQPGMEGGNAFWDILLGDVNPSGKLVDTFAKDYWDYPSANCFSRDPWYTEYREDIFVGYRYFSTFDPNYLKVRYPFGFGLSYTEFEFKKVQCVPDDETITLTVDVKNIGKRPGREVVQAYFSAPQGKLGKAALELCAYQKTKLLNPGETETIKLLIPFKQLCAFDDAFKRRFLVEKGEYKFFLGNSIKEATERGALGSTFVREERLLSDMPLTELPPPLFLDAVLRADGTYSAPYQGRLQRIVKDGLLRDDGAALSPFAFRLRSWGPHAESGFSKYNTTLEGQKIIPNNWIEYFVSVENPGPLKLSLLTNPGAELKILLDGIGETQIKIPDGKGPQQISLPVGFDIGYHRLRLYSQKEKEPAIIYSLSLTHGKTPPLEKPKFNIQEDPKPKEINFEDVIKDPEKLDEFVESLSLDELIHLLGGHGACVPGGTGSIGNLIERGIAPIDTADGPAGLRLGTPQIAWPVMTALSCTWDTELLYKVGLAICEEAERNKVALWLAPALNIHRNPLCGRNFEYSSEDPYLAGKTVAALVKGVQHKGTVGCEIKHFLANNRENYRLWNDSRVSERALREIYLRGFEIAVREAKPWAIMTCYNAVNGVHPAESKEILNDLLREEWGFQGFLTTDWGAHSTGFKEIKAGNDVSMSYAESSSIKGAYHAGLLSLEEIRACVKRILNVIKDYPAAKEYVSPKPLVQPPEKTWRLKCAESTKQSAGIGRECCEDEDGGLNPTCTARGTWEEYFLTVKEQGEYSLSVRFSSPEGDGGFKLLQNGEEIATWKNTINTEGWQKWQTASDIATINLKEGETKLRFVFTGGSINLNWFELTKK